MKIEMSLLCHPFPSPSFKSKLARLKSRPQSQNHSVLFPSLGNATLVPLLR